MHNPELLSRIAELEAQNLTLVEEDKRLREALNLPLENATLYVYVGLEQAKIFLF